MQRGDHVYYEPVPPGGCVELVRGNPLPRKRGCVDRVLGDSGDGLIVALLRQDASQMGELILCAIVVGIYGCVRSPSWAQAIGMPAPSEEIERFLDSEDAKRELLRTIRHRALAGATVALARTATDADVEKLIAWIEQLEQRRVYWIHERDRERSAAEKAKRDALDEMKLAHARATESMRDDVRRLGRVKDALGSASCLGAQGTLAAIREALS